jgi:regulator of sirC expression with transglutaminase-like and TPR domain
VALRPEAGGARDLVGGGVDRLLEPGARGHVFHHPAVRTDEVVMVLGEVLGQLVACELTVGDDAVDQPGLLEHDQVPVDGALRQAPAPGRVEDFGDRHGPAGGRQRGDDRLPVGGHALVGTLKARRHRFAQGDRRRRAGRSGHVRSVRGRGHGVASGTFTRVDATERFTELVRRPPDQVPLDEAALLIAAHAHPELDSSGPLAELDRLAHGVGGESADDIAVALFREGGFAGNTVDYGDPRNSYLDDVLSRRLGIPITLSVVMIEVGRRLGVPIYGVGMPGHFLVQAAGEHDVWFDPFHGGRRLDERGCQELYEQIQNEPPFTPALLRAVDTRAILSRMLANLQQTFMRRDPASLAWAVRLRLRVPGLIPGERRQLAALLGGVGRFLEAAAELDAVAADLSGDDATQVERDAIALRSRAN